MPCPRIPNITTCVLGRLGRLVWLQRLFFGSHSVLAACALLFVSSAQADQEQNLDARFESFFSQWQPNKAQLGLSGVVSPSLDVVIEAHDNHRMRDLEVLLERMPIAGDGRIPSSESIRMFALASSFFHQKSFRSASEICNLVSDSIQMWSFSSETRKVGNLCAYSVLKTVIHWGRVVPVERDFAGFLRHPGWSSSHWSGEAAPFLVAAARGLSKKALDPLAELHSRQMVQMRQQLRYEKISSAGPDAAVGLLAASLAAAKDQPALALDLLEAGLGDADSLKAALGSWSKGRILSDIGRSHQGGAALERAAELLVEAIRRETYRPRMDPVRVALIGRLVQDVSLSLSESGFIDRAQITLSVVAESLGVIAAKQGAGDGWIHHLHGDVLMERARIAAQSPGANSLRVRAGIQAIYADLLSYLAGGFSGRIRPASPLVALPQRSRLELAAGLGIRSRHLDAALIAEAWTKQSGAELESVRQSETLLHLGSAARRLHHLDGMTWVDAAFGYTVEFADALRVLARQMRAEEARAGRSDPADAFADGVFDRLIRAAEIVARQHKAAQGELDSTGKGGNSASRLGSAAGLLGGAVHSFDLAAERSKLARKGSQLFAGSSLADRSDALRLASDAVLESSVALVEGLSKRSRSSMRPHSLEAFERRAAHLCRSLLRSHELMLEMIAFEEQRELDWQRSMAVVLDHVARAEDRRRLALSSLEGLLERDKGQLDGQIKGALARRESTISESMLHAQAAGLIASNRYAENIERLREYVSRAGRALDEAAKQGGLR